MSASPGLYTIRMPTLILVAAAHNKPSNREVERAPNNSLMLTRLAGGNAAVACLQTCPRMKADGPSRRAA